MIEASAHKTVSTRPAAAASEPNLQPSDVESRLDPITGQWTIFAPYRDQRPDEFRVIAKATAPQRECPFCCGHESSTPPPIWIGRVNDDTSTVDAPSELPSLADQPWSVRVVPNKYPVVSSALHGGDGDNATSAETRSTRDKRSLFQSRPVKGGHEVIIESPHHIQSLTELDWSEVALVFKAYQERIQFWQSVPDIRYISVFKNVGGQAGASIAHTHSQLIATNAIPKHVAGTIDRMRHHQAKTGCCLQCDLVRAERKDKRRVVSQTDSLIAYCPYASPLPMLVRITTKDHQDRFDNLANDTIESVSRMVVRVIGWLEKLHPDASYNYLLQTRPSGAADSADAYHWSLDIFPRLTQVAGFEWSTQCMINPVLPELAAAKLRECAADEDPRLVR